MYLKKQFPSFSWCTWNELGEYLITSQSRRRELQQDLLVLY
jgi:hypothetical protein